jgi:apolipoprotein N-acyltransferase
VSVNPARVRLAGDGLALAAGAALALAFAPVGLGLVAPLALATLFVLWSGCGPGRAAWRGWLFGLGLFGAGASWVRESFEFSEVPPAAAVALTALFVAYLAAYPALLGYAQAHGRRAIGRGTRLLLALPAGWVLAEWLRGWLLTGFPWLALGYSQIDTPLAGYAPVLGVYGVSAAVALTAGALVGLLAGPWRSRLGYLGLALAIGGAGWAAGRAEWTSAAGEPRQVAVLQGNVAQQLKWRDEERAATLERYLALTRGHWDADLIVWPETAVPAFAHRVEGFLRALAREAAEHGSGVVLGIPYADPESGRYYNSVLALGDPPALYHKRHLVPFGEFVPLAALLGRVLDLLNAPMSDFSAGPRDQPPLEVAGLRLGVSICYEDAFGEEVIDPLPEATLLVNLSNDAWFGDSIAPHQHLEIARMRALETGRELVRATNTGISALIDWRGRVTARGPQFEVHVLRGTVRPRSGATPYVRVGNAPVVVGALAALALAAAFRPTPARSGSPRSAGTAGSRPAP